VSKSGIINIKDAISFKFKKRKDIPGSEVRNSKKSKILENINYSYLTHEIDSGIENDSNLEEHLSIRERRDRS
jgi:hypothetical protein